MYKKRENSINLNKKSEGGSYHYGRSYSPNYSYEYENEYKYTSTINKCEHYHCPGCDKIFDSDDNRLMCSSCDDGGAS